MGNEITPEQAMQQFVNAFQAMTQDQQAQLLTQIAPQPGPANTTAITPDQLGNAVNAIGNLATALTNNHNSGSRAKLSTKLPIYKGEPGENILMWALQINSVFIAQSITEERQQVAYAATALEEAALHWYLNQCQANGGPAPWDNWGAFVNALKQAFQPPHYQSYLRTEIQKL